MSVASQAWRLWEFVSPDVDDLGPGFREELGKQMILGLRVAGAAAGLIGAFLALLPLATGRTPINQLLVAEQDEVILALLGAAALAISATDWGRRHVEGVALTLGIAAGAAAGWGPIYLDHEFKVFWGFVTVLLVVLALMPLRPLAIFAMGLATTGIYAIWAQLFDPLEVERDVVLTFVLISTLCLVLTGVIYRLRIQGYRARADLRASLDALERAQAALVSSQKAAALGRLAAALTHELSTPIGVLSSAAETLRAASAQLGTVMERPDVRETGEVGNLVETLQALSATTAEASQRAGEVIKKAGRFTHLDRPEHTSVDLNGLLRDVAAMLSAELPAGVQLELALEPVPSLRGFPQHLTDTFLTIMRNAIEAIPERGVVRVSSGSQANRIRIRISDNGRGIPPERLVSLFEPQLRAESGRVKANWGLFVARQVVRIHGGNIEIDSTPGQGTTVTVSFRTAPATSPGMTLP
ncbi:MAG: HAMP domain-containing histidine kinase [Gemmatimonadota bacterium]|nr:MAG: HAMP domain-containing histidine kinase [Gemmatimonadota bacterium]